MRYIYCRSPRSSYTKTIGTQTIEVDQADVDAHTRCLIAGVDAGLAKAGLVQNGYSIAAFRRLSKTNERFVTRIYFRDKASAEQFVRELDALIKPTAKVGWTINELKGAKPATDFDSLDYEGKVKDGIKQLRTRLGDDSLDLPKVFFREGTSKTMTVVDNVAEAAAERARQAQERAEELAKTAQRGLQSLEEKFDDLTRKQAEELERLMQEVRDAINKDSDEVLKKVAQYRQKLLDAEKDVNREDTNVRTLENRLKRLKDSRE
ncbi:MAG: hypothetical protein HC840_25450 [Leptolyngbyaceae cyanobacterium RM2_2_4]|nr:hypothetical protein [Leptolyngbyaceae cyanobacterium RM2_2_4]